MSQTFRTVLAGCGSMSETWLKVVTQLTEVDLVGLIDIRPEAAKKRADEIGRPELPIGSDLKEMLRQTHAEAFLDCTIPEAHFPNVMLALNHGCHVLTEKPMADSMDHARQMVAAAQASGRTYAVIQNYRYQPGPRRLKHLLQTGTLGELTTVNADFYIGAHFGGFRDTMEHVLLLDMAIHTFDTARFFIGTDPISVYCREWNPAGSWYRHGASAVAVFEFSNGVIFTYRGSWCAEGLNTGWQSEWRFVAQHGSVRWDGVDGFSAQTTTPSGGFLSTQENVSIPRAPDPAKTADHASLIKEFFTCLTNHTPPETIATDNIKSLAMVFAAIESATTGQAVRIRI